MEALSPVFAALGVVEFDALNDLASWLDGIVEPSRPAETSGRPGSSADPAMGAAAQPVGREA